MSASKTKKDCPSCSIRSTVFTKYATDVVDEEKTKLKKMGLPQSKRTWDFVVNRIIREWGIWNEHQK